MARRYKKGRPVRRKSQRKPRKKRRTPEDRLDARKKARARRQKDAERQAFLKKARRFGYTLAQLRGERKPPAKLKSIDFSDIEAEEIGTVSVHSSLAEATNALDRLRDQKQQAFYRRSAFTSGLSVGLSVVAVLGVGLVLVYVLFRDKKKSAEPPTVVQGPPVPIILQNIPASAVTKTINVPSETEPQVREFLNDSPLIDD